MGTDFNTVCEKTREWLKENTKVFAFKKLEKDIIVTEVCVECGQCVSICPENALTGDTSSGKYVPTLTGKCTACGLCYAMCPRTKFSTEDLLGDFQSAWRVRAVNKSPDSQDGGAVTVFLQTLLENKFAKGAVVTCQSDTEPWRPIAKLVSANSNLSDCAGTLYTHSPVVDVLLKTYAHEIKDLAIVGTSCNIEAVVKMESYLSKNVSKDDRIEVFKIGLFCMESFDYPGLVGFLKDAGINIEHVTKMAISGGKFKVNHNDKETEWPIAELDHIAAKSCSVCRDFTCKGADISCGNVGTEEGWSTVLIRSNRAAALLEAAKNNGAIEAEELEPKDIRIIGNVARLKATKHYKN